MSSYAPETLALGQRLQDSLKSLQDWQLYSNLTSRLFVDQDIPELREVINSKLAQAERRYLDTVEESHAGPSDIHYEVSAAEAAEALCISENTIRNWDVNGCPLDENYPGRFSAVIFFQWAKTYQSLKRFNSEAKKHAIHLNTSNISKYEK